MKLALAAALSLLAACASTRHDAVHREGAPISSAAPIPAAAVLEHPERYEGKTIVVEGSVSEVCQVKGCWMVLGEGERWMRVTFKDYAFFVPKDAAGGTARVEGLFTVKKVSVAQARHYLEDAGRHEEAARVTAPVATPTLVASGVEIRGVH
jgi:hypothetical protein